MLNIKNKNMHRFEDETINDIVPNTKYVSKVDTKLLLDLFDFQTPTKNNRLQQEYFEWINTNFIKKNKIKCVIDYDKYGNIYITKGKTDIYPCVVSHLDTVHDFDKNFKSYQCGNFVIGMSKGYQCGLGADPKAGLYILLQLLLATDNIKCVLFLNEECGYKGSSNANMDFFKDCSFLMQFDRNSFENDIIEHTNGSQVLSEEFKSEMYPLMRDFHYEFNYGTGTDIGQLRNNGLTINSMNISNGSFNEHCSNETCSINHMLNALNFGFEMIKVLGKTQYTFLIPNKLTNLTKFSKTIYPFEDDYTLNHFENRIYEATNEDLLYLDYDCCPECFMSDTIIHNEDYCECVACGIQLIIPETIRKSKQEVYEY